MTPRIDINLPPVVWQRLQTAKDVVTQSVKSLSNSAQQVGESLKTTANQTTDQAINTVNTALEQSWQTAEQIKSTTSVSVKTAIASFASDWLNQHPGLLRFVQILGWATNHPIISLVIILFALALIWSIIKVIIRLIETASWSVFQIPLKLIQVLIKASFLYLMKFGSFTFQKVTGTHTNNNLSTLETTDSEVIYPTKQQRLAEISLRLEAIQQEQKELIQEAANLIAADK